VNELTAEDISFLIESLQYTKRNFESTDYSSADFRKQQVERVERLIEKLRGIRNSLK
jgi:tagatose-1,6-bisphosphate aldolase